MRIFLLKQIPKICNSKKILLYPKAVMISSYLNDAIKLKLTNQMLQLQQLYKFGFCEYWHFQRNCFVVFIARILAYYYIARFLAHRF